MPGQAERQYRPPFGEDRLQGLISCDVSRGLGRTHAPGRGSPKGYVDLASLASETD
jgi:hypothetical protein